MKNDDLIVYPGHTEPVPPEHRPWELEWQFTPETVSVKEDQGWTWYTSRAGFQDAVELLSNLAKHFDKVQWRLINKETGEIIPAEIFCD